MARVYGTVGPRSRSRRSSVSGSAYRWRSRGPSVSRGARHTATPRSTYTPQDDPHPSISPARLPKTRLPWLTALWWNPLQTPVKLPPPPAKVHPLATIPLVGLPKLASSFLLQPNMTWATERRRRPLSTAVISRHPALEWLRETNDRPKINYLLTT